MKVSGEFPARFPSFWRKENVRTERKAVLSSDFTHSYFLLIFYFYTNISFFSVALSTLLLLMNFYFVFFIVSWSRMYAY
jgi:hypothetical protein